MAIIKLKKIMEISCKLTYFSNLIDLKMFQLIDGKVDPIQKPPKQNHLSPFNWNQLNLRSLNSVI